MIVCSLDLHKATVAIVQFTINFQNGYEIYNLCMHTLAHNEMNFCDILLHCNEARNSLQ